jgi:hypothetical protein
VAKTLVFCTSYFETEDIYYLRYKKWISYYMSLPFSEDKTFFMLDDHSDLSVADDRYNFIEGDITEDTKVEKMNFYHFDERWGNNRTANHPGWFRSFLFSLEIAETLGYEKIIHIESDMYLLSPRICEHIDELDSGWVSFRCPTYRFPESSLQVINKDNFGKFNNFKNELLAKGLETLENSNVEWLLPLTHVEEKFTGDRYGERGIKQGPEMDYYAQARLNQIFVFDLKKKDNG